mmetsp:Transcript_23917/g.68428  ORF Transcript_23917/g.68428 Transcript_23917/m.68428 type:complete len:226 (-) Transcript_23917:245-922(-)
MPRRAVRRLESPLFVQDETEDFTALLRSGSLSSVRDMLGAVSPEDAEAWTCEPLDDKGRTALHCALSAPAAGEQLQLVRHLCARRADVNVGDANGVTPLHLAAHHGSKYVLRALLCAGGDNLRRTADGRTTVDFATCNPSPVEAFEVVGWPGQGPAEKPLEPRKASGKSVTPAAAVPASGGPTPAPTPAQAGDEEELHLAWPLVLTAIWFALLAVLSTAIIRALS